MKILVVDDSKAMRMIVIRTLKRTNLDGSKIIEATNGVEALKVIEAENPELVLSDWNMPEMKGIELLQKVRETNHKLCFGFITSESSAETKALAKETGADFLVTKPFTAEMLESSIPLLR